MIEIERKFLVAGDYKSFAFRSYRITQGYICNGCGRTVRVRRRDSQGFLTIKGPSADGGLSRFEWETEIPLADALALLQLCDSGYVDKTRHLVQAGAHVFEVDEFHGDNEGLVVAEVELASADEVFERPAWLGKEVTGERQYYNAQLCKHPYKEWEKK